MMPEKRYKVGSSIPSWGEGISQTITFVVTDDCNLRCKYCYITHKSSTSKMDFETAKRYVDFMLEGDFKRSEAIIIDFIGGEPFMEIDLIDKICDYFKMRSFELNHQWYWNYRFNISSNGIYYGDEPVQVFLRKNVNKVSCGMTIDGTKEKHDMQRVFPDGSGSYDAVMENIELYKSQHNNSTKVTFASDDLPLLKESIISLWDNGITEVAANVVYEDVWKEGDDLIFETQLKSLADYILENKLYDKFICSLFEDYIGSYYGDNELKQTSCGAGKMMAFDASGNIYPCIRYKGYSLNKKDEWIIGNLDHGIDMEKVRPFITATYRLQSDDECLNCEVAVGCTFCQGFNYDEAETPTNFSRVKYICKMHKARVRANDYYFAKLYNIYGIERQKPLERKRLYFLLSDDFTTYCQCSNESGENKIMNEEEIIQGLEYAHENFYDPIFVHSDNKFCFNNLPDYQNHNILHIISAKYYSQAEKHLKKYMLVFDKHCINLPINDLLNCMLNVHQENLNFLSEYVKSVLQKSARVNINVTGINKNFDLKVYKEQLMLIKDWLVNYYNETNIFKEVNLITDLCFIDKHNNCKAGDKSLTLAPDGNLYICNAFYMDKNESAIGNTISGIENFGDSRLYKTQNHPLCIDCDAYQCINCVYINKHTTNEVNVSPSYQCAKGLVEREVARIFQEETRYITARSIPELDHIDPMRIFVDNHNNPDSYSYYQYNDRKEVNV